MQSTNKYEIYVHIRAYLTEETIEVWLMGRVYKHAK